jgi:prefoldin subunit 5
MEEKDMDPYDVNELARTEDPIEHEPQLPPHTGRPGESVEDFERRRVASVPAKALDVRDHGAVGDNAFRRDLPVRVVVDEALQRAVGPVREEMATLRQAIEEQNRTLKTIDAPLEAIADSHERAATSFEALRHDIDSISTRLAGVEGVIDTAGLMKAHGESARLLQDISREVREQLKVTRDSLVEIVRVLSKINADAIEATKRAQDKISQGPREVVVIGAEGKDLAELTAADRRKLLRRLQSKRRKR